MPGAGKSTVGVVLAKILGYDFIDADLLIQKEEGRLLSKIIEDEGTEGFIKIENRVNASIKAENSVISTGGSVVYCPDAMEHLRKIGRTVYLEVPLPVLKKRLGDLKGRGVVLGAGQTIEGLFSEREPLYKKYADIVVNEGEGSLEDTLSAVLESIG